MRKLTRLTGNAFDWERPTDREARGETTDYIQRYGFGHEDWLFRFNWMIDGWRYGFIQGVNRNGRQYIREPIDLTLFTVEPDGRKRLVYDLRLVECLNDEQAEAAEKLFVEKGWLEIMRREVVEIGGDPNGLDDRKDAPYFLNVRFRPENRAPFPPATYAEGSWFAKRHRYQLYDFPEGEQRSVDESIRRRVDTTVLPPIRPIFRRGSAPVTYDPVHQKMQAKLFSMLQQKYGAEQVVPEQDFVDLKVEIPGREIVLYEIKTDLEPKTVIRQALGQILEYAYYPPCTYALPLRLVVVGRTPLKASDREYLQCLKEKYGLELNYEVLQV